MSWLETRTAWRKHCSIMDTSLLEREVRVNSKVPKYQCVMITDYETFSSVTSTGFCRTLQSKKTKDKTRCLLVFIFICLDTVVITWKLTLHKTLSHKDFFAICFHILLQNAEVWNILKRTLVCNKIASHKSKKQTK